jgi:hypothetical protein
LVLIAGFVEVSELGLALEQMADVLNEWDFAVLDDERADLLALADRMNISIRRVLEFCPTLIAWRPSAFRPDISQVTARCASVLRSRRLLTLAIACCCCYHRYCRPR